MKQKVRQLVDGIQFGRCSEIKAIHYMTKIYNSVEYEEFTQCFSQVLQGFIQEDYNNPSIKNVLAFMGKFVGHITSIEAEKAKDERPLSALLGEVIEQVIKYHSEPNEHCKFNVCSFISTTLQNIGNKVAVNGNIIKLIQEAMFENLQDLKFSIRLQAVLALARIQEPANLECPTVKALEACLLDTNHLVRREVVMKIIPSPTTLVGIQKRTRDIDANVRSAAFRRLAEIAPRYFKIVQRHYILKSGFMETEQRVKKIFLELLIPKWLTSYNGNYLEFLKGIKLDADEDDIRDTEKLSNQIMEVFFKSQPINQLIEILPLNDDKLIPEDSLQTERVLYWNILVKYLRQSDELEEHLEQVIPELIIFCGYIQRLIDNTFSRKQNEGFEENLNFQNLLYHLFDIGENYDLSEEVGRKALEKLVKKCLKEHNWQPQLLKKLIQMGSKLASKVELFTNEVYNIIFDLWQPIKVTPQDSRQHEFKLAQLRVKMNRLEDALNDAISSKDYEKSHKIKLEMDENRKKLEDLSKEGPPPGESIRAITEDSAKLCWCLDLLGAILMVHADHMPLPHSMIMCRDDFLTPLIVDKRVEIVTRALKCLGIYCIYDQELAKIHHHLGTFKVSIMQYNLNFEFHKTIFINSISLTCDLIIMHGTDWIAYETNSESPTNSDRVLYDDTEEVLSRDQILTFDFFISVLLKMLDDEDDDIRDISVTVFAKLMYYSIPINSTLLTRLILKWFNPSTTKILHQKLGMILKAYIHSGNAAKKIVIDAIVPVLTVIANAPQGSPLADLNIDNAVQFLAIISDSGNSKGLMHLHTELARILVDEITLRPDENVTIYFAKMLNLLNINPDQSPAIRDIIANAELILEKETLEKAPKQQLTKFVTKLKHCTNTNVDNSTVLNADESKSRIEVEAVNESNQSEQTASNLDCPGTKSLRINLTKIPIKNATDFGAKSSSDSELASPPAKLQRLNLQKEKLSRNARIKATETKRKSDGKNNLGTEKARSTRKKTATNNENQNSEPVSSSSSEMASPPAKLQRLSFQKEKTTRSASGTKKTETNRKSGDSQKATGKNHLEKDKITNTRRKDKEATTTVGNQNHSDENINSTRHSSNTRISTTNSAKESPRRRSMRQENKIAQSQQKINQVPRSSSSEIFEQPSFPQRSTKKTPVKSNNLSKNKLGSSSPEKVVKTNDLGKKNSSKESGTRKNPTQARNNNLEKNKSSEEFHSSFDNRNAKKNNLRKEKSSEESYYLTSDTEADSQMVNAKSTNLRKNKSAEPDVIRKSGRKIPAIRNLRKNADSQQSTSSSEFQKPEKILRKSPAKNGVIKKTELEKNKIVSDASKTLEKKNVATTTKNIRLKGVLLEQVANSASKIPVAQNKRKKLGRRSLRSELLDNTPENTPRIIKRTRRVVTSSISTNSNEQTRRSKRTNN